MRILVYIALLFFFNPISAQQVNSTYEWDDSQNLEFDNGFGGAYFNTEDNPKLDSLNRSEFVAKFSKVGKNISEWAGVYKDLEKKIVISNNSKFQMQVFSPLGWGMFKLKLEQRIGNKFKGLYDADKYIPLSDTWQNVTFDISSVPTNSVTRIVLTFDFGKTEPSVFYFDNIFIN